ncbi:MAG: FAD-dependent oxidoreductase [Opitutales bacterium]|nr:FAD-dependent oxidoreductase [Opitutales bacterium]
MEKVAIIGTGIAGMSAAYKLHGRAHLTLFERENYIGGHTNTVSVEHAGEVVAMDTGFMVYNEVTYPNLIALFEELDVPTKQTDMSFGVNHVPSGIAYCGSNLNQLFAQRSNALRPDFWRMIRQILRFNREATALLDQPGAEQKTLREFLQEGRYSRAFSDYYLLPMTGAIWSTPPDAMLEFPALTLIRFLRNHGLLGVNTHFQWRTVEGGSRAYRERLIAPFRDRFHLRRPARAVEVRERGASVFDGEGNREDFDHVVIATHADEALALRVNPTEREVGLLRHFHYEPNRVTLHTDERVMPATRRAWAAWNYRVDPRKDGAASPSTHYWMNALQGVSERHNYFVSVNDPGIARPGTILWEKTYDHPLFDAATQKAQKDLPSLNAGGPVYYAGSYFRYGFHEDALMAGLDAAAALLRNTGKRELLVV